MSKKIYIIAVVLTAAVIFAGCASMNLENYRFQEEDILFSSSFDTVPEEIKELRNVSHKDETLHSHAPEGDVSSWWVDAPISRNSRISFRMKIGQKINDNHPASHINVLMSEGSRLCINFDDRWGTGYFWNTEETGGHGSVSSRNLEKGKWYRIDLLLAENKLHVFVDGKRIGTASISGKLPGWGAFGVECHNELWIDRVELVNYESYEVL